MTKPKVLISDKMDPNAARIFEERGCDVDVITGESPEELKARIGEYHGLAIRSSTTVTKEILDAATNLKVIGRAGIGVDNVDIPYASGKGVVVMKRGHHVARDLQVRLARPCALGEQAGRGRTDGAKLRGARARAGSGR